jgi:Arc-like DNA binding domain
MAAKREKAQVVQFKLRIRESLRARIEVAARKSGISMNSEIERRLEESFDAASIVGGLRAYNDELKAMIEEWRAAK